MSTDVIDRLAGIASGSHLDRIRDERQQARDNAQASYLALFGPDVDGEVSATERLAVAAFVAGLHEDAAALGHYRALLGQPGTLSGLIEALEAEIVAGKATGPYGAFPAGPLSGEDHPGPIHRVAAYRRTALGERLAAALEHTHLLVFRPRDASQEALRPLLAAGWSTAAIVTLSQLVAFLAFQIRSAAGLRVLAALDA